MTPDQLGQIQLARDVNGADALSQLVAVISNDLLDTAGRRTELAAADFFHYS